MTRFRKGTLDHDGDGRKGGSMKGDGTMAKKKAAAKKTPAPKPNETDALVDEGLRNASADMQSGMTPGPPSDVRAQQVRDQFARADELAAPNEDARRELEERRVAQQVRGF